MKTISARAELNRTKDGESFVASVTSSQLVWIRANEYCRRMPNAEEMSINMPHTFQPNRFFRLRCCACCVCVCVLGGCCAARSGRTVHHSGGLMPFNVLCSDIYILHGKWVRVFLRNANNISISFTLPMRSH